ncbi:MAG: CRISPR-associated endonuclease Cas1 [Thermoplasmatales archaeon]
MQLIVDGYGSYIHRKENLFEVETKIENQEKKKEEFSADMVSQILITSKTSISSGAIQLAMEKQIDIIYLDWHGMPYARTYPCKLGGTTLTRRRQATKYLSEEVASMVKAMIGGKISNQLYLLKQLAKARKSREFEGYISQIKANVVKLDAVEGNVDETRDTILGIEGYCSTQYWAALTTILPFKGREQEAKDIVNAMLNYGYGILYSEIEKACIIAGLDPYLGFLHTDRYGKPSTVLDMIEEFRQTVVDRAVITLFARKQVDVSDGETSGNTFMLTKKGRQKIIDAVMERLHSKMRHNNREYTLQGIMLEQARQVARVLLGEKKEYAPFIAR